MIEDKKTELLTILAEECAEVIVECSKIHRFDNDFSKLEKELGDLICMIELLHEDGHIDESKIDRRIKAKRKKLEKYSNIFK